jgi:hypothetical protein
MSEAASLRNVASVVIEPVTRDVTRRVVTQPVQSFNQ